MTTYGFAINLDRCIGCRTCTISCKMENQVPDDKQRIRVLNEEDRTIYDVPVGTYPNLEMEWTPVPCQHCANPPCVAACQFGATSKREDGIVIMDQELCVGCLRCIAACPYGARQFDDATEILVKCDLCAHRLDAGLETTMCQIACPGRAIVTGDITDPSSEIAETLASYETILLLPEEGTGPNAYYWNSFHTSA